MNLHLNMENVVELAELIAAKHGISITDAMGLAEFNLRFADSYAQAAARV